MPRVFIVNFAGHNYEKAERYGEVTPVTVGYVSLGSLDRILFDVITGLRGSSPSDWLLPSGLIALNAVTAAVWMRMHGEINLLLWDRKTERYREMKLKSDHVDYLVRSLCGDDGDEQEEIQGEGRPDSS